MTLQITGLYAGVLGLMFLALTYSVIIMRAKTGVSIMHGESVKLAERIRQHGNFAENVPLALILMGIFELQGGSATWVHAMGIALVASRVLHPIGLKEDNPTHPLRIIGALATHLVILSAAALLVWHVVG